VRFKKIIYINDRCTKSNIFILLIKKVLIALDYDPTAQEVAEGVGCLSGVKNKYE
jgi:hypothetical protein